MEKLKILIYYIEKEMDIIINLFIINMEKKE